MGKLDKLRNEIDDIDKKLIELFEKRMEIVLEVAEYKKKNNIPILNREREHEVINKNVSYLRDKRMQKETQEFFESLMSISRKYQSKQLFDYCKEEQEKSFYLDNEINNSVNSLVNNDLNIGFQGVPGSFSEQALFEYFGEQANTHSFNEFEDVFKALKNGKIDYGVLPIENSSTGSIADIYDLLRKYGLYIVGEKCIKVEHNLLGIKGAKLSDIKEVYSHIQGFRQSSEFFKQYPDWKLIPYHNTAISAKLISDEASKQKAAVASKKAAEVYNLDIIKSNINYNTDNYTRFVIVGRKLEINEQCNKISIVLTVPHKVGALHNILIHFAENNLSMMKIESRPIINKSWEYFFYIDFEGNLQDENVKKLVMQIERKCSYFKLLGNYRAHCTQ
jgi:chorismate mutase/prephenate dehydratase